MQTRHTNRLLHIRIAALATLCLALAACNYINKGRHSHDTLAMARVQGVLEQLVEDDQLDPDMHYLVPYSSDGNEGHNFVPIAVPVPKEFALQITHEDYRWQKLGHSFTFANINGNRNQEDTNSNQSASSLHIVATRRNASFSDPVLHELFSTSNVYSALEFDIKAAKLIDRHYADSEVAPHFWETGSIEHGSGKGRYVYSHMNRDFDRELSLSENMIAILEYDSYSVILHYFGPPQPPTREEAQANKELLLRALQNAIVLDTGS